MHGERGGEGELYGKSNMETSITIGKIDSQQNSLCGSGNSKRGSVTAEGWDAEGDAGEGTWEYRWLILVDV